MNTEKAIEWIKRAQARIAHSRDNSLPLLTDARRFLNEARIELGDETELAK